MEPLKARGDVVIEPYQRRRRDDDQLHDGRHARRQAVGVAGVDVSLEALDKQAKRVKVLDSGYAYVAAPHRHAARLPAEPEAGRHEEGAAPSAALAGKSGWVEKGDDVLFYAPVETTGWTFVAVAPKDEILAPVAGCARR